MATRYVNENNVYAYRDADGHWCLGKQSDIDAGTFILRSTVAVDKPYAKNVQYVNADSIKTNVEITPHYIDYTAVLTEHAEAAERAEQAAEDDALTIAEALAYTQSTNETLTNIIG